MLDPSAQLRLRARLLEFLKFRVLASQEAFFEPWQQGDGRDGSLQSHAHERSP